MANKCKNCGLRTMAKKRCGHCKNDPQVAGPLSDYILSLLPQTRRQILQHKKMDEVLRNSESMSSADVGDHQPRAIPLPGGVCGRHALMPTSSESAPLDLTTRSESDPSASMPSLSERFLVALQEAHDLQVLVTGAEPSNTCATNQSFERFDDRLEPKDWISYPIVLAVNYFRFGSYITCGENFLLDRDGLTLTDAVTNCLTNPLKINVYISLRNITELKYCFDLMADISMIILKTNEPLNHLIQNILNVGPNCNNGMIFDVNSDGIFGFSLCFSFRIYLIPDLKQNYVVINLRQLIDKTLIALLMSSHKFEVEEIDTNVAKAFLGLL